MQTYEDGFVIINENGITVKGYYFPIGMKTIPWKNIQSVDQFLSKESEIPGVTYKGWGMGLDNIWWARDIRRYFRSGEECIIITTGSWIRKGFTVENPSKALETINHFMRLELKQRNAAQQQQQIEPNKIS